MKNFAFVAIVVLILGCAYLLWPGRIETFHPFESRDTPRFVTPPPAKPIPEAPKTARAYVPVKATAPAVAASASKSPFDNTVPSITVRPPFPAPEQIPLGAHEEALTMTYGYPELSAVTTTNGHIVETLVYTREREQFATVVRLVDGRVSAAYTKNPPAPARGTVIRPSGLED